MQDALKKLYDTCWYIEQTKSGRYFFHRHKNLNAQVNSYTSVCTTTDRDAMIEEKLKEMFEPRDKRCYQKLAVLPALDKVQLERDRVDASYPQAGYRFPAVFRRREIQEPARDTHRSGPDRHFQRQ